MMHGTKINLLNLKTKRFIKPDNLDKNKEPKIIPWLCSQWKNKCSQNITEYNNFLSYY